jgi:hypothetical protein
MRPSNGTRARLPLAALAARAGARQRGIQIGPRIRVGGSVGHFGEQLKQNLGQVAKIAAVPASFVNPGLGALLAVGGRALHTNEGAAGVGDLVGAGLKNYATGKVGSAVLGGVKRALPAVAGAIAGSGAGGGGGALPTTDVNGAGMIPGGPDFDPASGGASGGGGALEGLGALLPHAKDGSIDWMQLGAGGLAALQGYQSAQAAGRAGDLENQALAHANELWSAGAPLREQGMASILNPRRVPLGDVYRDPTNPFAPAPAASAPMAATPRLGNPLRRPVRLP